MELTFSQAMKQTEYLISDWVPLLNAGLGDNVVDGVYTALKEHEDSDEAVISEDDLEELANDLAEDLMTTYLDHKSLDDTYNSMSRATEAGRF